MRSAYRNRLRRLAMWAAGQLQSGFAAATVTVKTFRDSARPGTGVT
jgi:hypothetical protein